MFSDSFVSTERQTVRRIGYEHFSATTWALHLAAAKPRIFETMKSSPYVSLLLPCHRVQGSASFSPLFTCRLSSILGDALSPDALLRTSAGTLVDPLSWQAHRRPLLTENLRVYSKEGESSMPKTVTVLRPCELWTCATTGRAALQLDSADGVLAVPFETMLPLLRVRRAFGTWMCVRLSPNSSRHCA